VCSSDLGPAQKLLSTYIPILEGAAAGRAVTSNPNVLVKSGRTSWSKPNFQNPPRKGSFRECFVARPGTVWSAVDLSTAELRALAQVNIAWFGWSKMADVLRESHGFEPAATPEEADVLLLNTCSIREKAQEKVFSLLGRWRELKQARPGVVIGVGGCVASQEGEAILERAPFVDIVFGPQTLHRLPAMLDAVRGGARAAVDISFPEI
jgi:hypothetical protein